jgi:ribosomal protein S18 acetylase RimI-like enzyme
VPRNSATSPVTVVDWRQADAAELAQCYRQEREHWLEVLGWETSWTWAMVERARITWGLPGYIARDADGRVCGWSFQLVEHGAVRIGGMVSDSPDVTTQLVDRILEHAREIKAELVSCFIADRAPNLSAVLAARGFICEPFHYLTRQLSSSGRTGNDAAPATVVAAVAESAGVAYEAWDRDLSAAADLFASAYDADAALHFTTSGTRDEWRTYVRQLVEQPACGSLDDVATVMLRDQRGLVALALVTTLAPGTAHLAQLAVRPDSQGRGLARQMLSAALARADAEQRQIMTLLVAWSSAAAQQV